MANPMAKFGLVLGGGGVKGLAHIALLKQLDAAGIRPSHIAGTSMGAIIGALYACGISGAEMEARIKAHILTPDQDKIKQLIAKRKHLAKWFKVFSINTSSGSLLDASGLFEFLFSEIGQNQFEDLAIPFAAVATDFYSGHAVVLDKGDLLQSVMASMAVPGVFPAVDINGRTLIDGGTVNNLPCDLIAPHCDKLIASDVICLPRQTSPKSKQMLTGALSIMLANQTRGQLKRFPPDVLFQPDTDEIDAFDLHKINLIFERAEAEAVELPSKLKLLGTSA